MIILRKMCVNSKVLLLIAYTQKHSLNRHVDESIGAIGLEFSPSLHLHQV